MLAINAIVSIVTRLTTFIGSLLQFLLSSFFTFLSFICFLTPGCSSRLEDDIVVVALRLPFLLGKSIYNAIRILCSPNIILQSNDKFLNQLVIHFVQIPKLLWFNQ
ncbi:unnamed protein product [Ilex paraguariensis]|uniref:Uncharacterized protein n=1 Tax=Ilex paraguariensis TaxID=185542 RepID=A0ABC8V197_9AQUA